MSEKFYVGLGKSEITPNVTDAIFLGFARPNQKTLNVKQPLHSRCIVFKNENQIYIYCNTEICFVTQNIYDRVLKKLKNTDEFKDLDKDYLTIVLNILIPRQVDMTNMQSIIFLIMEWYRK